MRGSAIVVLFVCACESAAPFVDLEQPLDGLSGTFAVHEENNDTLTIFVSDDEDLCARSDEGPIADLSLLRIVVVDRDFNGRTDNLRLGEYDVGPTTGQIARASFISVDDVCAVDANLEAAEGSLSLSDYERREGASVDFSFTMRDVVSEDERALSGGLRSTHCDDLNTRLLEDQQFFACGD